MKRRLLLMLTALVFIFPIVKADYFRNQSYKVTQPDGKEINCYVSGDEYFNWLHDADGYTIIQAPDGYFYYGIRQNELVVPSQYKVSLVNPETVGLQKWAKISKQEYQRRKDFYTADFDNSMSTNAPHLGVMNNVSIYIKFSGDTEFTASRKTFDDKFNPTAGNTLKAYYSEVSYNQFTINTTGYPECEMTTNLSYTDTHPRNYFEPYNATTNTNGYNNDSERTSREHTLLFDAVTWINANSPIPATLNIDGDSDGRVDNVCFIIHGGNGAWSSLLWAHRWSLYSKNISINGKRVYDYTFQPETQVSVKTLCHEMFHALGAPDLYHYDDKGLGIAPVGSWDLMESGGGHMGAYMKWKYAAKTWITSIPVITAAGTYTLEPLTSATNNCYKIASPNSSQFFIVEYRKKAGTFESTIPGSGLLVYRIDPSYNGNANGPPDEVYIYRINGSTTKNGTPNSAYYSLESGRTAINSSTNPSPFLQDGSAGGLSLFNITSAGSTISFTVGFGTLENPSGLIATPVSTNQIDVSWKKNTPGNNVMLAYNTSSTFGIPKPGTAYSEGNSVDGGGKVLYCGSEIGFSHKNLVTGTYYYKLWSVNNEFDYSDGITTSSNINSQVTVTTGSNPIDGGLTSGSGTYLLGNPVTVSATPTLGFQFVSWSNKGIIVSSNPTYVFNAITDVDLIANFTAPKFTITALSNPSVAGSISGTGTFNFGTSATIVAKPAAGWDFVGWYENEKRVSGVTSYSFNVLGNRNFEARFDPQENSFFIDISVNNALAGSVSGGGLITTGSEATLNALASQGWAFINWTEAGKEVSKTSTYKFAVSASRSLVANFAQIFTVTASANPVIAGTVAGSGIYNANETVTLKAVENPGYKFYNWTENSIAVSANASYTFSPTANRILVANFLSTVDVTAIQGSEVRVYPNPCSGMLNIDLPGLIIRKVVIADHTGRIVMAISDQRKDSFKALDLSNLKSGIYALQLIEEHGRIINRKVILHK